ncbi:diguanylate cyclase [Acidaminobacter sp. JC074]|uniref:sensor domain-containing diguanylate cyclase n=1 Tax=Acidaminobacter sp. JC074 TaxID=2530199 RepID=UPI001F0F2C1D|nr:diguanylate cyclase [Acidaminobacter sp. JC074]MCH4887688.1 diguanylate cyclase [Acidaminobacter sp. JC074]
MKIAPNYLNTIIDELNMMVVVISKDNTLISANKSMLEFAGLSLDDIKGEPLWDLPWLKHDPDVQNKLMFALSDSYFGTSSRFNASYKDRKGLEYEIDFIVKPVMNEDEPEYFICMGYNITELVQARKALTDRERRIKAFFDHSNEGYFFMSLPDKIHKDKVNDQIIQEMIEHFKLEDISRRFTEIYGKKAECAAEIFEILSIEEPLEEVLKKMVENRSVTYQITFDVNGDVKHTEVVLVGIYEEDDFEGCFGIVRDTTNQVEYLEKITYLAHKDYLTGINNRRNFFTEGNALFDLSKKNKSPLSLVMFDIDHFKRVNDTYGHDAGDVVIRDLAKLVDERICEKCVFGRYGGEEYILVIPHPIHEVYKEFETIRSMIDKTMFDEDHVPIHITISLGIYSLDLDRDTLESGITKADRALYESKSNGRNQTTIYVDSIHGDSARDELTGLFTEQSMRYKLNKTLMDVKAIDDTMWVIYFKLNVLKEDRLLTERRHFKTIATCLSRSIRNSDYIGRVGKHGFMVVLRNVNMKQVDDKHQRMIDNIEIGFSGMIGNVLTIKTSILNVSRYKNDDQVVKEADKHLEAI